MCAGVLGEERSATASVASLVSGLSSSVSCGVEANMMDVDVRSWLVVVDDGVVDLRCDVLCRKELKNVKIWLKFALACVLSCEQLSKVNLTKAFIHFDSPVRWLFNRGIT